MTFVYQSKNVSYSNGKDEGGGRNGFGRWYIREGVGEMKVGWRGGTRLQTEPGKAGD